MGALEAGRPFPCPEGMDENERMRMKSIKYAVIMVGIAIGAMLSWLWQGRPEGEE